MKTALNGLSVQWLLIAIGTVPAGALVELEQPTPSNRAWGILIDHERVADCTHEGTARAVCHRLQGLELVETAETFRDLSPAESGRFVAMIQSLRRDKPKRRPTSVVRYGELGKTPGRASLAHWLRVGSKSRLRLDLYAYRIATLASAYRAILSDLMGIPEETLERWKVRAERIPMSGGAWALFMEPNQNGRETCAASALMGTQSGAWEALHELAREALFSKHGDSLRREMLPGLQ